MAGDANVISTLLANPLILLGLILLLGAFLGGAAERIKIPWITGCIVAGVVLGSSVTGVLSQTELHTLGGFLKAALAVIAFNIGSQLVLSRLKAIGRSIALLAFAQLLAPFVLVLIGETLAGVALATALIVAAVAPATAPTTTYAVIKRLNASGPFVDRVLGVLAINDAATILIFAITSAAALTLLAGPESLSIGAAFLHTFTTEALSIGTGIALGAIYLGISWFIADGRPGSEARLTALLVGLIIVGVGGAIALGLSHLLVPLAFGFIVANGVDEAERHHIQQLIRAFEEPLYIIFFVLAGAHLPLSAAEHVAIVTAAVIYILGRFAGKFGGIFLTASALRLDRPTRLYLGLCFPSQGGLAMGLILAFHSLPAVKNLPAAGNQSVETAISIILFAVLITQLVGPLLIDFAVRRASASKIAGPSASAAE
jgi:Kef-type K+ transport system membrane component KefB